MLKKLATVCLIGLTTIGLTGCIIVSETGEPPCHNQMYDKSYKCQKMYTPYEIDQMNPRQRQQAKHELQKFDEQIQKVIHAIDYWSINDYTK